MKIFGIVLVCVLGVLLIFLLLLCGFIFNNIIWRKTIPVPKWIEKMIAGGGMSPDRYQDDFEKAAELRDRIKMMRAE